MAYEKYKTIRAKEEFFDDFDEGKVVEFTENLKDYIYEKYVNKCKMLQRDGFTCQNREKIEVNGEAALRPCRCCKNVPFYHKLTAHHIKFKKNFRDENGKLKGNPDKVRNKVTLCYGIHNGYHKADEEIIFPADSMNLPPHIRGHTFKLEKPDKIDWKAVKENMKKLRQEIKFKLGDAIKKVPVGQRVWFRITAEQILLLLRWLYIPYDEMAEDDD